MKMDAKDELPLWVTKGVVYELRIVEEGDFLVGGYYSFRKREWLLRVKTDGGSIFGKIKEELDKRYLHRGGDAKGQ